MILLLIVLCWWILSLPKWTIHVETRARSYLFRYKNTRHDKKSRARNSEWRAKNAELSKYTTQHTEAGKESSDPYRKGGDNGRNGKEGIVHKARDIWANTEKDTRNRTDDGLEERQQKAFESLPLISSLLIQLVARKVLEDTVAQAFARWSAQFLTEGKHMSAATSDTSEGIIAERTLTAEEREALLTPVGSHRTGSPLPVQVPNVATMATGQAVSGGNGGGSGGGGQRVVSLRHLDDEVLDFEPSGRVTTVRNLPTFPLPGTPGAPYFSGVDITEFLDRFEELGDRCEVTRKKLVKLLPKYSERRLRDLIRSQEGYEHEDWDSLKEELLREFAKGDRDQQLYSRKFLEAFKNRTRTMDDDLKDYCVRFNSVAVTLKNQNQLDEYTRCLWFLHGLPRKLRLSLMKKQQIKPKVPSTMNFQQMYQVVLAWAETAVDESDLIMDGEEETVEEVLRASEIPCRNDPIIIGTDGTFPTTSGNIQTTRPEKYRTGDEAGTKTAHQKTLQSESQARVDDLTSKLEALTLTINTISDRVSNLGQVVPQQAPRPAGFAPAAPNQALD